MPTVRRHTNEAQPRVWPARVLLGFWVVVLLWLMVADRSWVPAGLLAATVVVAVAGVVLGMLSGKRLSAEFSVPGKAAKGATSACSLRIASASALPVWRGVVAVRASNPVTGEAFTLQLPVSLGPNGAASVPFEVNSAYCGSLALFCEGVWVQDLLGIARRRRELAGEARVPVPPEALILEVNRGSSKAYDMESFTYSGDRPGDDPGETFSVREYMPGDSVRRIHWKLSGKLGTTMVRESGFPIYSSLLLLVETGWDAPGPDPAGADAQMEAVSSIMLSLVGMGVAFEAAFLDRASGSVVVRRAADETVVWEFIGLLMAAPREVAEESCVRVFLEQSEEVVWARSVYVTAGKVGADADLLAGGGGTFTVLRCLAHGEDADGVRAGGEIDLGGGNAEVVFFPETWKADLAEVEL